MEQFIRMKIESNRLPINSMISAHKIGVFMRRYVKIITTTISLLLLTQAAWSIDVWVWTNDEASLHYKVNAVNEDHLCGSSSNIEIKGFPDPSAANEIGMEKVVEYSGESIVQRWSVPIDKYVLAVEGKSIYIPYKKRALRLFVGGTNELTAEPHYDSNWIEQCPHVVLEEFPNSGYVVCHEYKDLKTQEIRQIAYEGPCT